MVAVAGMRRGLGTTTAAMNLAAALVQQGKEVLLVDEHRLAAESACAVWSIYANGNTGAAGVIADCGVAVLAACDGALPQDADPHRLRPADVVLIDAALDEAGGLSPLACLADELVVVLQPDAASVTATYSGIKRLHYAHALRQLRFLVNGVADPAAARQIMANLVDTGSRYLAVSLQPAGWVRADPHLQQARRLNHTVVEAFPASPAAADFRRIAADMGQWAWRPAASLALPAARQAPTNTAAA
ncbi:MAG: cellulose synthase operon protein YhjQ/BcsQ [Variovorax sp.]